MTEMGKLIEEFSAKGVLLDTAGLRPSSEGFRIRNNHGKFSRTDGPFTEAKEVIGGYAILKADSMEEAVAADRTLPRRCTATSGTSSARCGSSKTCASGRASDVRTCR